MIPVALPGQLVHGGENLERVDQRQIPIQLAALPVHDADVVGILCTVLVRHEAIDLDRPGRWIEDAGQELDRGRLARAVRPEIADDLALLDLKAYAVDGLDGPVLGRKQPLDLARDASSGLGHLEVFGEMGNPDHMGPPRKRKSTSPYLAEPSTLVLSGTSRCLVGWGGISLHKLLFFCPPAAPYYSTASSSCQAGAFPGLRSGCE
jgi:hypothetical protein